MRTETVTKTFLFFSELTEENQAKAIERNRDSEVNYYGWEAPIFEDAKQIGACIGLAIEEIQYSGFASQGDGARFRGTWKPKSDMVSAVKAYAPLDEALHTIAERLAHVQEGNGWQVECEIRFEHWGNYVHEGNTSFEFGPIGLDQGGDAVWMKLGDEKAAVVALRAFMRWIYRQLESEYEYLTSDECIKERLLAEDEEDGEEMYEVSIEDGEETLV